MRDALQSPVGVILRNNVASKLGRAFPKAKRRNQNYKSTLEEFRVHIANMGATAGAVKPNSTGLFSPDIQTDPLP
jgi:hypothetical protein